MFGSVLFVGFYVCESPTCDVVEELAMGCWLFLSGGLVFWVTCLMLVCAAVIVGGFNVC